MQRTPSRALAGVFIVLFSFPASSAAAEQQEASGPQATLTITPNRYERRAETVGSSITVISEAELERRKEPSLLEVLRTVPGAEVVQTGGAGRTASVFLRGADSDQTLVLIDGVRVNSNADGGFDFADLRTENIERIEVLRGPQSVLYGSEAIGGVINIITKRARRGLSASASAEGGSHSTQRYSGSLGWGSEWFNTSSVVSFLDTEGISAAAANRGNPEDDGYQNVSISTGNTLRFLEEGTIDASLLYTKGKTELDGFEFGLGAVDDPNFEQERDFLSSSLNASLPLASWMTPSVRLGVLDDDLKGTDPDDEFNNFIIDNRQFSAGAQLDVAPFADNVLSLGYSFEQRNADNKGSFKRERDINSFYLQDQHSWKDCLYLTAGVRHDNDADFGEETTFRVTAAALQRDWGTKLHSSYGTAFKAPSFNELFFPNFGNPELDAETAWGYDVGVEQSLLGDRASIDVTFFHSSIDDLITTNTETFIVENIEKAEVLGIESALSYRFGAVLSTTAQYTYTDSENETTGEILPRRPRHRGSLSVFFQPLDELDGVLTFVLVNSRRDSDGAQMDDYETVDLTLRGKIGRRLRPYVRLENLFDEDYEEVPGFGTSGFAAFGGLEASL